MLKGMQISSNKSSNPMMLAFALATQDGIKVRQEGNFPFTTVPNDSYPFWAVLHLEGHV